MGKIKKMNELSFTSRLQNFEAGKLKGGIGPDCGFSTVLSGGGFPDPKPITTIINTCKCFCAGCITEDGGPGFSVGMIHSHL